MDQFNKKINLKNIFFSATPGLISIILTFLSLPIYLQYLTPTYYSSFLISHIFLSLSLVFNFNIGKVASIKIQNKNKKIKNEIIINALLLSFIIAILSSFFLVIFLNNIFYYDKQINFFSIFFGLITSILFINTEAICKGLGKFKIAAISNFIFYGLSISAPSFFILAQNHSDLLVKLSLFDISIIFKLLGLVIIILSMKNSLRLQKITKIIFFSFRNQSLWMTLSSSYNQIFEYLDKYLIKLYLHPIIFINYTIAQQVASKLTIFSNAITSVLLPNLARQKNIKNKRKVLNLHLLIFYIPIGLFLIIGGEFFDDILRWWLRDNFNNNFYQLFNIFIALTFIASKSHIIISLYEANEITKKNSIIETFTIIPFFIFLIILIYKENVMLICYLILAKEILVFIIRSFIIKKYLISYGLYLSSISLFLITWFSKINEINELYMIAKILFFISILLLIYNAYKQIK